MLSVGGIFDIPYEINPTAFLYVQPDTLKDFGGNQPYDVKYHGALYLWFSSLFLIPSFMTYGKIFNQLKTKCLLLFGS